MEDITSLVESVVLLLGTKAVSQPLMHEVPPDLSTGFAVVRDPSGGCRIFWKVARTQEDSDEVRIAQLDWCLAFFKELKCGVKREIWRHQDCVMVTMTPSVRSAIRGRVQSVTMSSKQAKPVDFPS